MGRIIPARPAWDPKGVSAALAIKSEYYLGTQDSGFGG